MAGQSEVSSLTGFTRRPLRIVVTVYDAFAVDAGDPSGNVPQGAQDEVQVRLLGPWIMPQAYCQCIRDSGITELLAGSERDNNKIMTAKEANSFRRQSYYI